MLPVRKITYSHLFICILVMYMQIQSSVTKSKSLDRNDNQATRSINDQKNVIIGDETENELLQTKPESNDPIPENDPEAENFSDDNNPEPESKAENEPESENVPHPESEPESEYVPHPESELENEISMNVTETHSNSDPEYELQPENNPKNNETAEGENGIDVNSSPESEPEAEKYIAMAEPAPDFDLAFIEWGSAWEFHIYFIAVIFMILTIYSLVNMIRIMIRQKFSSKIYFLILNFLIFATCVCRVVFMLHDPYNANKQYHEIMHYLLYNISFPNILSSFCILFLALLNATQMRLISRKLQKAHYLIIVIIFHYILSIVTDILTGSLGNFEIMLVVCQIFTILWGFFLFFGYIFIFKRLFQAFTRQKYLNKESGLNLKTSLSLAAKITLITSIFGVLWLIIASYGLFSALNMFNPKRPEPWPWWAYHFCIRMLEICMCALMLLVAGQPLRTVPQNKRNTFTNTPNDTDSAKNGSDVLTAEKV